jgi:hypothetical protein
MFTVDCRFEGLGSAPSGADVATFVNGVSSRLDKTISVHHCHTPEIVLTTDTCARGIWAMEDYVEWQDGSTVKEYPGHRGFYGFGHYEEEYRVDAGDWKISFLRLTRLRIDAIPTDHPPAKMGSLRSTPDWLDGVASF